MDDLADWRVGNIIPDDNAVAMRTKGVDCR